MRKGDNMNTDYIKQLKIGGQLITAEYFDSTIKFPEKEHNKLSDFWDTITLPFYRIKHKTRHIYHEIRYSFQRMFKDYDDRDVISMDCKFIDRYYKILTEFKNNLHGHPGRMTEEEWTAILDEMTLHLYYMDEENVEKELMDGVPESWIPSWKTSMEIMEYHKNEFFRLFSEHFYDLWD